MWRENTTMTDDLEFVDEVPPGYKAYRSKYPHPKWAAAMRANPGKWTRLPTDRMTQGSKSGMASNISRGRNTAYEPAGAFEAITRKQSDDDYAVWARFVGGDETDHLAEAERIIRAARRAERFAGEEQRST
jgi:hypothetical protein